MTNLPIKTQIMTNIDLQTQYYAKFRPSNPQKKAKNPLKIKILTNIDLQTQYYAKFRPKTPKIKPNFHLKPKLRPPNLKLKPNFPIQTKFRLMSTSKRNIMPNSDQKTPKKA